MGGLRGASGALIRARSVPRQVMDQVNEVLRSSADFVEENNGIMWVVIMGVFAYTLLAITAYILETRAGDAHLGDATAAPSTPKADDAGAGVLSDDEGADDAESSEEASGSPKRRSKQVTGLINTPQGRRSTRKRKPVKLYTAM